ncbi:methyl-accepting chemotaxis protein [Bacillus suaedaesalsae]|uniref:HAMP domain-containing protein n=1 Tax=Bacillus suaedaesalsae TaxID=2810349 RepID=A0ABS2DM13_9BACI|nr:methyl-accepting chemotaxis protein [Bacillus suaedaesalsae]MBM6619523.1 HAMP domain-containing protein [Bacillus suaedaesalsae]
MKIKVKLLLLVALLLVTVVITGILSNLQLNQTKNTYTEMQEDDEVQLLLKSIQYRFTGISNDERAFLLTGDMSLAEGIEEKIDNIQEYFLQLDKMKNLDTTDKKNIKAIEENLAVYFEKSKSMVSQYNSGNLDLATETHIKEQRKIRKELVDPSIENFIGKLNQEIEEDKTNLAESQKMQAIIFYSLILVLIVVGLVFAILIIRSIVKPMYVMTKSLEEIANGEGDLTRELVISSKDELGMMANSFNKMITNLRGLIQQVGYNADQVAAAAEELTASSEETTRATEQISSTVQEVAMGSEKQVASLKETSHTIHQLSTTVTSIADSSEQATKTAELASQNTVAGNEAIVNIIAQMNGINETVNQLSLDVTRLGERSNEISEIIQTITGIADQTNLLALNAAIEAARAGEHGRGFAVVSDEVRKLAEQSASSAQQISQLIETIQLDTTRTVHSMNETTTKVSEGISLVQSAGNSFRQIQHSISEVSLQIKDVSHSIMDMRVGTDSMVQDIKTFESISELTDSGTQEMASVTEEQVASMEEIAASSASLSQMAEELQILIGKFKV